VNHELATTAQIPQRSSRHRRRGSLTRDFQDAIADAAARVAPRAARRRSGPGQAELPELAEEYLRPAYPLGVNAEMSDSRRITSGCITATPRPCSSVVTRGPMHTAPLRVGASQLYRACVQPDLQRSILTGARCLLVLDDVWQLDVVEALWLRR